MMFLDAGDIRIPVRADTFKPTRRSQSWPRTGWKGIVYEVCLKHHVKIADLMTGSRSPAVTACRWEVIWRVRHELRVRGREPSAKQIGHWLDMHHTAVMYALRRRAGMPPKTALQKKGTYGYSIALGAL